MSYCSSCPASVLWVVMLSGKRMPLDLGTVEPFSKGAIVTIGGISYSGKAALESTMEARKVSEREAKRILSDPAFTWRVSHYATCPDAASHRKGARAVSR